MGNLLKMFNYLLIITVLLMFYSTMALGSFGSAVQLAPDSDLSYEEEYKMFMAEDEEDSHSHLSRQKRFVYLNVDTNMAVALLIGVPLTFVLPSMSNLFSSWRRKRSIEDSTGNAWALRDNDVINPEMEKVSTYFQLLDIPDASCQLRAVCEFSSDPEKFYPLSDVILKRIRNPNLPSLAFHEGNKDAFSNSTYLQAEGSQKKSLYELYNEAADEGQMYGYEKCHQQFANSCHYPIEKLLNMPVIRFWSALQTLLKFSFKDVSH